MPRPEWTVKPETNAVWMKTTQTAAKALSPSKQGKWRGPLRVASVAGRASGAGATSTVVNVRVRSARRARPARQHGGVAARPGRRGRHLLVVLGFDVHRPDVVVGPGDDVLHREHGGVHGVVLVVVAV